MTREEAIEYAEKKNLKLEEEIERPGSYYGAYAMYSTELEFVSMAISALRQQDVTDKNVGKMTNADRIRAMSDDELAKLLCCTGWRMFEQKECLEWLQRPAGEEDKHEDD